MERRMDRGWSKDEEKWVYGAYLEASKASDHTTYIPTILREEYHSTTGKKEEKQIEIAEFSAGRGSGEYIEIQDISLTVDNEESTVISGTGQRMKKELFEGDIVNFQPTVQMEMTINSSDEIDATGVIRYGKYTEGSQSHIGFYIEWLLSEKRSWKTLDKSLLSVLNKCLHGKRSHKVDVMGNNYECKFEEVPVKRKTTRDRGWDILNKRWVYGAYFEYTVEDLALFGKDSFLPMIVYEDASSANSPKDLAFVEVKPESVGRSTGESVKEQELFEGDIIKVENDTHSLIGVVRYGEYKDGRGEYIGFYIEWKDKFLFFTDIVSLGDWLDMCFDVHSFWEFGYQMIIIGNETENPELLSKKLFP